MSIIAAGTTTTTALSSTGNTDGTLQFQVNGTTPSVTLNTLGAIGVGSTPAFGTSGQVLTSAGSTAAPSWTSVTSSQWVTTGSNIYYNTGNVGIGTSSPATKLDVSATSGINAIRVINTSTDTTSYGAQSYFRIDAGGNHIGGLKSTVRNLIGLSTPALYLTTAGSYPIAFGIGDSAQPSMVFDAASNLGLGVVPSAWGTASNFEQRLYTSINTWDDGAKAVFQSGNNYYQIGSTFYYKATTEASFYRQRAGVHSFHSAPSGTAGNPITFAQVFGVNESGAIGVGSTPSYGTSGQVLTSGGSGAAPSWASPAGGGSMIFLSTVTASGASTVDIETTFDSTYDQYVIYAPAFTLSGTPTNGELRMRLKIGGTYPAASGYMYASNTTTANTYSGLGSSNNDAIYLTNQLSDSASYPKAVMNLIIYVSKPSTTNRYKTVMWEGSHTFSNNPNTMNGVGWYSSSDAALTGVRLLFSGGATFSGTFRLYGIKNS